MNTKLSATWGPERPKPALFVLGGLALFGAAILTGMLLARAPAFNAAPQVTTQVTTLAPETEEHAAPVADVPTPVAPPAPLPEKTAEAPPAPR